MGLIPTIHHWLVELFTGAQTALLLVALAIAAWIWWDRPVAHLEGLPVIEAFTDIYREGFDLMGELAGPAVRRFYESDLFSPDQIRLLGAGVDGPALRAGEELLIRTTWRSDRLLEKMEQAGFSSSRMKQARRYVAYIDQHKELAVRDMYESKVFASIKLAQALLESDAGRSRLAKDSRNHFGIKARHGQEARRKIAARRFSDLRDEDFLFIAPAVDVYNYHDDNRYDRFEVYHTVGDSYRRHTDLLTRSCSVGKKGCYAWIWRSFPVGEDCDITAAARQFESASGISPEAFFGGETRVPYFAAAAAGLKMGGYATSPTYHRKLWYIIDTYELWRFDLDLVRAFVERAPVEQGRPAASPAR